MSTIIIPVTLISTKIRKKIIMTENDMIIKMMMTMILMTKK